MPPDGKCRCRICQLLWRFEHKIAKVFSDMISVDPELRDLMAKIESLFVDDPS